MEEMNPCDDLCLAQQAQLEDQPVDVMLQPTKTAPWEHLLVFSRYRRAQCLAMTTTMEE